MMDGILLLMIMLALVAVCSIIAYFISAVIFSKTRGVVDFMEIKFEQNSDNALGYIVPYLKLTNGLRSYKD